MQNSYVLCAKKCNTSSSPSISEPSRSATVASLVAQSATSTPQLTMASPELDKRAAVVLSCVVTRQMDSSPTPLPLAVQAATTPPLLCEVAAERSIFCVRVRLFLSISLCACSVSAVPRARQSQWAVLKFERRGEEFWLFGGWRGCKAEV